MKEQAFANAFATVTALVYVICAGWVTVARDGFMVFTGNWVHGIDMKVLPYTPPTAAGLIFGFVTATVATWVAGYLFVWLYYQLSKK